MKRSQAEIMGLAIIVLLISVGFIFYVAFTVTKTPSRVAEVYKYDQMGENMVNALLEITVPDCEDYSIEQLISDCAMQERIRCPASSCDELRDVIETIFEGTLNHWYVSYYFTIKKDDNDIMTPINAGDYNEERSCDPENDETERPGWLPVSVFPYGDVIVRLDICRK